MQRSPWYESIYTHTQKEIAKTKIIESLIKKKKKKHPGLRFKLSSHFPSNTKGMFLLFLKWRGFNTAVTESFKKRGEWRSPTS